MPTAARGPYRAPAALGAATSATAAATARRFALRVFAVSVLAIGAVVLLVYWVQARAAEREELAAADHAAHFAAERMSVRLAEVGADLGYLAHESALRTYLDQSGGQAGPQPAGPQRAALERDYARFAAEKAIYDQIRFVDTTGHERIRVDLTADGPRAVPEAALQDKSARPYVARALALPKGRFDVSRLDLNVENGRIETPAKPVIRFGMPVFDAAGTLRGAVVLNALGRPLLDVLGQEQASFEGDVWLLDGRGYWLEAPDPADEWAFMYPGRLGRNLGAHAPAVWAAIQAARSGRVRARGDAYSFARVDPAAAAGPDRAETADWPEWIVVAHLPAAALSAPVAQLARNLEAAAAALFLLAAAAALVAGQQVHRRRVADAGRRGLEERFRLVADTAGDGIVSADAAGRITFFNAGAERMFGLTSGAALGQSLTILMPERFRTDHETGLARVADGGATRLTGRAMELTGRRGDGSEFPLEMSLAVARRDDSPFTAILRDISIRKRQEERIRANEERTRALFDSAPDGIVVADAEGRILRVNSRTETLFGIARDALLGQPVERLLPAALRAHHVDLRSAYVRAPRAREMGEGQDLLGRRADGTTFPVAVSLSPVETDTGMQFIASIRDVTRQKEAERLIRDNAARLAALLEAVPDAVVIADHEGTITTVNAQTVALFGHDRATLAGAKVEMLLPEQIRARHIDHRHTYTDAPRVRAMGSGLELHGRRADGTVFPVAVSLSPVETDEGPRVIATIRDVTGQKATEQRIVELNRRLIRDNNELAVVNKELEAFSASVSHDLRSPLRAIDGFSKALIEDYADRLDDDGRNYLDRVRGGAQRMGLLIDDLLNLARITRAEVVLEDVDMTALARQVAAELAAGDPDRGVQADIAEGVHAQGDPRLLKIALDNLIGNAWKFTGGRDPAHIAFGTEDGGKTFFVRDNGAGFDMAYADQLFRAFQRLHDARVFPGTGVGLATVQRIIHKHGGRIWAEAAPDEGAVFRFTLEPQ